MVDKDLEFQRFNEPAKHCLQDLGSTSIIEENLFSFESWEVFAVGVNVQHTGTFKCYVDFSRCWKLDVVHYFGGSFQVQQRRM